MFCDTGQISFKHLSFIVSTMLSIFSRGHGVWWGVLLLLQEEGALILFLAAARWVNENTGWISAQSHAQCVHLLSNLAVMASSSNNLA